MTKIVYVSTLEKKKKELFLDDIYEYRPIISAIRNSSSGRRHRIKSWKRKNSYHVLSDIEANCLFKLIWDNNVVSIREQYPLEPDLVKRIHNVNKIKQHKYNINGKNETKLFTIDFLVEVRQMNGDIVIFMINCKYKKEAEEQKDKSIKIEKAYAKIKGYKWILFTEDDIDIILGQNVSCLIPYYNLKDVNKIIMVNDLYLLLIHILEKRKEVSLDEILTIFQKKARVSKVYCRELMLFFIARKFITIDISKEYLIYLDGIFISRKNLDDDRVRRYIESL